MMFLYFLAGIGALTLTAIAMVILFEFWEMVR